MEPVGAGEETTCGGGSLSPLLGAAHHRFLVFEGWIAYGLLDD